MTPEETPKSIPNKKISPTSNKYTPKVKEKVPAKPPCPQ